MCPKHQQLFYCDAVDTAEKKLQDHVTLVVVSVTHHGERECETLYTCYCIKQSLIV